MRQRGRGEGRALTRWPICDDLWVVPGEKVISLTRYCGRADGCGLGITERSQLFGAGETICEPLGLGVVVVVSAIGPSSFLEEQPTMTPADRKSVV